MRPRDIAGLGQPAGAVERDPAHHLRLGEVTRSAAYLPDPGVLLLPDRADEIGGGGQPAAGAGRQLPTCRDMQPRSVHHVAVDIELQLWCGGISDPNRTRLPIAIQRKFALGRLSATV